MTDQELLALSRNSLFKNISLTELKNLFQNIPYHIKKFEKNCIAVMRGERYDSLFIILKGEFVAEISDLSGKIIKIETLKNPSSAAAGILFASDPSLPVTLTAVRSTVVAAIPRSSVLQLCMQSREILINYLEENGDKINFLAEKIRLFKFSNLKQKTAGYLIDLSLRQNSDIIVLPYTKETIAEIFGVTRPSLSRVFSELSRKGIITSQGKKLIIKNKKELLDMIETPAGKTI